MIDVESARDKILILSSELMCAKEMAALEKELLNAKISSLEADLKSKEECERQNQSNNITGSKRKRSDNKVRNSSTATEQA